MPADVGTQHSELFDEWVHDLKTITTELNHWWRDLHSVANQNEVRLIGARWPVGLASHPRLIALFRDYFFRVVALNNHLTSPVQKSNPHWGIEETDDSIGPIPPNILLVEMLEGPEPDLFLIMKKLDFIPIGENPDFEMC